MDPINVLISLHRGYGLGDAVQMSAVLRHLRKFRPNWIIDYRAEPGRQTPGNGIVNTTFCYGEPFPRDYYHCEAELVLYDNFYNYNDRPNTRVTSCLHERFGLHWDAECARYQVNVPELCNLDVAGFFVSTIGYYSKKRAVAVHYQGDSDKVNKDLTHEQANEICNHILNFGRVPLLLDWRDAMPVGKRADVKTTGRLPKSLEWGRDAAYNCAVISQCEAFVGIDSGPGKCASTTDTPALVTWTGHHPAPFHDPAQNTTHLVPVGYHGLKPVCNDAGVMNWFEANYNVRQYERDPVGKIKEWLTEVLR